MADHHDKDTHDHDLTYENETSRDLSPMVRISIKEYDVNKGDKKYPKDPTAVTILIAIVLFDKGKCFPTTDIGILIAVPPKPIPIKIPISIWKKIPVFGPA